MLEADHLCIGGVSFPLLFWRFDRRLTEMHGLVGKGNGTKPLINIDSHRKTIEVMNACYDSIQCGLPITLD